MTRGTPSRSMLCSASGPDGIALMQSRSRLETQILGMVPSSPGIRCPGIRGTNRSTQTVDKVPAKAGLFYIYNRFSGIMELSERRCFL